MEQNPSVTDKIIERADTVKKSFLYFNIVLWQKDAQKVHRVKKKIDTDRANYMIK